MIVVYTLQALLHTIKCSANFPASMQLLHETCLVFHIHNTTKHAFIFHLIVFHLLTYSTINASCNGGSSDVSESIYCSSTLLLSTDFDDPSESLILMQPSSTVPVESESVNIPTSSSGLLASMDITSTLVTEIASGSQTLELGSSQTSSLLYGPTMTSSFLLMETTFLSSAQSSSYFSSPPLSSSSNILMSSVLPSSLVQSLSQSILSTQSLSLSSSDILATPTPSPSLSSPPLVVSSSERVLETLSTTAHYMVSSSLFVTISTRPPTNSLVSSFSALFTQISTSSITPTPGQPDLLHSLLSYRLFVTFYSNKFSSNIFSSHSSSICTE